MRLRLFTCLSVLVVSLAACGGGGGGGDAPASGSGSSAPVDDTGSQAFSISGAWRAMSMAGIYSVSIDGGNGVIEFLRPDEVTGGTQTVTLAGMSRGSDGAYIFRSGFVVGGLPLDVVLYRVDHNTMAGQILSSRNNSLRRTPVILTRSVDNDLRSVPGDWVSNDVSCFYEQSKGRCESTLGPTEVSEYESDFLSMRLSTTIFSVCLESQLTSVSDCTPEHIAGISIADQGEGVFDALGSKAFVFHVAGEDLLFNHGREGQPDVLTYMGLSARDAALAPEALIGVWRVASDDGRTGIVTVNDGSVAIELDGRDPASGRLTRNNPLRSLSLFELDGQAHPYIWVGNEKLALVSGNDGYFLLHRE